METSSSTAALPEKTASKARDRMLDVAEELFAESGFGATSTRDIAAAANVTLGSVHYHFASKRQLFIEAFSRRARPFVEERMQLLREAHERWPDGVIPLQELIRRFAFPLLHAALRPRGTHFARMHARMPSEQPDLVRELRNDLYNESTAAYAAAFRKALPELSEDTLYWRINFMLGLNAYTLLKSDRLAFLSGGKCNSEDLEAAMKHIVPFLEAGLRAPEPA
ncbi:MAG: TetR/AcrR family transcriptional regulator [Pseudomonadota bacterium]